MCIVAVAERSLKRLPAGRFQYIRVYRCYSQRSLNHLLAGISSIYYSHRLISKKTSAARGRGGPPSHDLSRANNMSLGFTSPVLGHPDLKTCSPPLAPWHGASFPPLAPWHGTNSPSAGPVGNHQDGSKMDVRGIRQTCCLKIRFRHNPCL